MNDETAPAPGATGPEKPRGRCGSCGERVLLEDTFEREVRGKNVRVHRVGVTRHNIVGTDTCGPVVDSFVWHVYAKLQEEGKPERTFRTFVTSLDSPKERIGVIEEWEKHLESERTKGDAAPPTVVVERWELIGTR